MRFDLTDLSLFRHVVEAGSITHGAERAHLALAAASTRIRHMEEALGAALLVRSRQGVTPTQAGRTLLQHARTILAQAERLREDLGAYAGGLAGQVRVLSNTNALTEFLPETLSVVPRRASARQRRSGGAALRRDRRPDRRGRRRHRDRGRHGRSRAAGDLSVPQRPLRAGGRARSSAGAPRARSASPRCWTTISSGSIARARCSASSPTRRARAGRPLRLRVQLRSFDGVCRLVERNVGVGIVPETTARWAARTMAIKAVQLTDPWALRDLSICVRDYKALPPYARQLVDHMREERREYALSFRPTSRSRPDPSGMRVSPRHQHPVIEIEDTAGSIRRRRALSGKSAHGWSLVAIVRRRSAPTSLRPGSSALASTSDQANTV